MANEMSFAQALTEAKQIIIQQSNRIKADGDKMKQQQVTIVDQCATIADHERRIKDQVSTLERQAEELRELTARFEEMAEGRTQAEAVLNRQGEKITAMEVTIADLEAKLEGQAIEASEARTQAEGVIARQGKRIGALEAMLGDRDRSLAEQAEQISALAAERDELQAKLPTDDDKAALESLTSLLTSKGKAAKPAKDAHAMRIAEAA